MDLGEKPKLTREQRIEQRLKRVEVRYQRKLALKNGDINKENINQNINGVNDALLCQSKTKLQIKKSRDMVDDTAQDINDNVADIKLLSQIKASNRRQKCAQEYDSRMYRIEQCVETGKEINDDIDTQWDNIQQIKNPQALYAAIEATKLDCKQSINGYESVRKQFMTDFNKKSEQYINLLKSEESDITTMIWRMHDTVKNIKNEYETQIIAVEMAFMTERRQIIDENQQVLDELYTKRERQEFMILERKIMCNDKYHTDLECVRRDDQESYSKLKINLENHIQLLEQQLAEMRAMYQLNTEKLNYNFQVLKEREKENITTVDHLKRREKKLKESVTNIKEKFSKFDKKFKEDHKVLNDEYTRISRQYKELQRKFKHFQQTDIAKYDEICAMNGEEAVDILRQIMKSDQIISSQLLGIEWDVNQWQIPNDLYSQLYPTLNHQFHTKNGNDFNGIQLQPEQLQQNDDENMLIMDENNTDSNTNSKVSISTPMDSNRAKKNKSNLTNCNKYSTEQIMTVMKLLINQAPFLINCNIKEKLNYIPCDQQLLLQCDSILKSLGIEDIEDLEELISLFIDEDGDELSIEPHQTIAMVKKYVSNRDHTVKNTNFSVQHALTSVSKEKQERRKRKDRQYWKSLQHVFPAQNIKTWSLLEQYLLKYNKILEQRKCEALKIKKLQKENNELTQLLQQYLASDANKELIIPPSLIMDSHNFGHAE